MDLKEKTKLEQKNKELQAELNKIKKAFAKQSSFEDEMLKVIKEKLLPLKPINSSKPKFSNSPDQREIVVMLNDTHYGLFVDKNEVNGLNEFGWTQACRRTAAVINQAIHFKPHNRHKTKKVHLVINGDVVCGNIHAEKTSTIDKLVFQLNGTLHILTHAITALSKEFAEVEVHGIGGNHDENISKRENGNRVIAEVYDNNINYIFYALSVIFQNNKNIKFNFPKSPVMFLNLPGGRALVSHGHLMFPLGNPGKTLNVKGLSDALHRFNLGEMKLGREEVKLALFGHVHSHSNFTTNDGMEVFIAPSLSGLDSYAFSLGINSNFTGQLIFESVKNHIKGDSRLVHVHNYDNDSSLDKIIPIYKRTLKYEK